MAKKKQVIVSLRKRKGKRGRGSTPPPATSNQVTRLGSALRYLGGLGGGALGGLVGMPGAGSSVGSSLGAAISRWLGSGDYNVSSNSIVKSSLKAASSIPMMHNESQSVVIRHREYLGEVTSSTDFTVKDAFVLNPGNHRTFPWLSGIAANFQEYSFKGIVFHYIPSSGAAITTSPSLGTVMMQTSYRSTDAPPANKVEMLNEYCSNEVVPSETMAHPVECNPKENPFNVQYVRTGEVPAGETKLMYDLGVMHLATSGQTSADYVLGDLWVTYEVELKKPIVTSNVTSTVESAFRYYISPSGSSALFSGVPTASGTLPITAVNNLILFPKGSVGRYLITVILAGTFTNVSWTGTPTYDSCSAASFSPSSSLTFSSSTTSGGGTVLRSYALIGVKIDQTHDEAGVTVPVPITGGTIASVYLIVTPMSDSGT